ncbi:MAG: type I pantothenate kinase [Myxococcota bacterium]|jgi:type I pantothenate kinase
MRGEGIFGGVGLGAISTGGFGAGGDVSATTTDIEPYLVFERSEWRELRKGAPLSLEEPDIVSLKGTNSVMSIREVVEVFLPLTRLLSLHVQAARGLRRTQSVFLGRPEQQVPYLIGMAGSVAVGKSTSARILRELLARWPGAPRVELVTTDGFLYPNADLSERGLMSRKGFPESYRRSALLQFVSDLKAGAREVRCPTYSHLIYDVVPDEERIIESPDIVIIEGLNVLQTAPLPNQRWVSDFFDFTIYLHAEIPLLKEWYIQRFLTLRDTAFRDPDSYFHHLARLSDEEALERARSIWETINEVNLVENILSTRERASLILEKGPDHRIQQVKLRRH